MSVFNYQDRCSQATSDGEFGTKQCTYCGSISVADAIRFLKMPGTRFSGSDWKYGWPHKYYIEPKNPNAADLVEVASSSGADVDGSGPNDYWTCKAHGERATCLCPRDRFTGYWSRPVMGHRETLFFKFYNTHLEYATPEEFAEFAELSKKIFGITWAKDEKGIKYSCPKTQSFYGYQRAGTIGEDLQPVHTL